MVVMVGSLLLGRAGGGVGFALGCFGFTELAAAVRLDLDRAVVGHVAVVPAQVGVLPVVGVGDCFDAFAELLEFGQRVQVSVPVQVCGSQGPVGVGDVLDSDANGLSPGELVGRYR